MNLSLRTMYLRSLFTRTRRLAFYESVSTMVSNNTPIKPALIAIHKIHKTVSAHKPVNEIYRNIASRVDNGAKFAAALKPWIPEGEHVMIKAAEEGGELALVLRTVTQVQESLQALIRGISSALVIPTLYALVLVATLFIVGDYGIPFVERMFPMKGSNAETLQNLAYFTNHYLVFVVIGFGLACYLLYVALHKYTGPLRKHLDHWPIFSMYRTFVGTEVLLTLSGYIQQGVPVEQAMRIMRDSTTGYRHWHLKRMHRIKDREGMSPGASMRTGLFSPEIEVKFETYGSTGNEKDFADVLHKIARESLKLATGRAEIFSKLMNESLIAVFYIAIGWVGGLFMGAILGTVSQYTTTFGGGF